MQQLLPPPYRELEIEQVYRDLTFPEAPLDRPYVILNFVSTVDGQTTLGTGGAAGLGSATDHRLMSRLRTTVDGLLHGAGTVRHDNFPPTVPKDLVPERLARGLAAQPLGTVISGSGEISPDNRYFSARPPVIFTTIEREAALASSLHGRATVIGLGSDTVDLAAALRLLREQYQIRVLLCEGGPRLTHDLVATGLLDEIFLTLAPKLASDISALRLLHGSAFPPGDLPQLELRHVLAESNELFLRYRLQGWSLPAV